MRPAFDLPIDALFTYQGRNPKPSDFETYWDQSIAEMRALDPDIEIRPADFQSPTVVCSDLRFTGVDGSRVYAKLLEPRSPARPVGPGLVAFHGYSGDSGSWMQHLAYAAAGFTVAALDCRGQGGKSQDRSSIHGTTLRGHIIRGLDDPDPRNLLYRKIFLDTAQLAGIVMDLDGVDAARVAAIGGSQGGGLTLACAALEPRIALAAPTYPFLTDYQRTWEMDLAKAAYDELTYFFRSFDPTHEREAEIFERLGYIDVQHLAPRIQAKVFMAVSLQDTVCPPSTQFAAYNKIQSQKSLAIYPDFGHEGLKGHDDKIFQFLLPLLE